MNNVSHLQSILLASWRGNGIYDKAMACLKEDEWRGTFVYT
jgi:hypothetical protein